MTRPTGMSRERRQEFCRQVLESLSDLIEGEAPEELCREVDRVLGDCRPFLAFRSTLERTIRLTGELREPEAATGLDEEAFRGCVERVREKLQND